MAAPLARIAAVQLVRDALFPSVSDRVKQFIRDLPILPKDQIPVEDGCPICLVPFTEILKGLEDAVEPGAEDEDGDERGVTKLEECGHIFCRRDLAEWIRTSHGNCPTCRSQFVPSSFALHNPYGDDDASSDGGEYLPTSEGDEDIDFDYSESEYWAREIEDDYDYDSELESIPLVHEEIDERDALMEDEDMREHGYDGEEEVVGGVEEEVEEREDEHLNHHDEDAVIELDPFTDSEEEQLEVECGLTDGESNASTFSDEVRLADMGLNPILIPTEDDDGGDAVSGTDPYHSLK